MRRSFGVSLLCSAALMVVSSLPVSAGLIGLSSATPGTVYSIDSATGAATPLVSLTGDDFTSIVGLEYFNGVLYATDVLAGSNFVFGSIDLGTGAFTTINDQGGSANWYSLAGDPVAGLLYSVDADANNTLVSVTPGGVITNIGLTGAGIAGLAYDAVNGILYGVGDGNLYTINVTTGAATLVGDTGVTFNNNAGLAFDSAAGILYMNGADTDSLYRLDAGSGLATLVGSNGVSRIDGLTDIPDTGVPEPASLLLVALGGAAVVLKRRR